VVLTVCDISMSLKKVRTRPTTDRSVNDTTGAEQNQGIRTLGGVYR
jgi:hypothetical protein